MKKKFKLLLVGLALALVTVGSTYAWWTASQTVSQEVSMGNLNIAAQVKELKDPINYEPGLTTEQAGTIKNTGSIDAIVKIDSASKVQFADATEFVAADPEAVKLGIKPNGGKGYWYNDPAGNTYLILSPNQQAKITVNGEFVGDKMGNEYMGAKIDLSGDLKATQVMEGAMLAEFGTDGSDLVDYVDPDAPTTFDAAAQGESEAMQHLHQLLARGK